MINNAAMRFFLLFANLLSVILIGFSQTWPPVQRFTIPGAKHIGNCIVTSQNGQYGLLDKDLNELLPAVYTNISAADGFIKVSNKDSIWLYSLNGKKLTEKPVNKIIEITPERYAVFSSWGSNTLGIMDSLGKVLLNPGYTELQYVGEGYFKYRVNIMYSLGIMDAKGKKIIGDSLSAIEKINEGLAVASKSGSSDYGYLDIKSGKWVISPRFAKAMPFHQGVAVVGKITDPERKKEKFGLIDRSGNLLCDFKYESISDFKSKYPARVQFQANNASLKYFGAIDRTGQLVIPCIYEQMGDFKNGYTYVKSNDKYGVIRENGTLAIPAEYTGIKMTDTTMWIVNNDKYGIIDQDGHWIVPMDYLNIYPTTGRYFWGYKDPSYRLIDFSGKEILNTQQSFITAYMLFDDRIYVNDDVAHYIVNDKGEKLVKLPYDQVGMIKNGTIAVEKGGKYGFVDVNGKPIREVTNSSIVEFSDGIGAVQTATYDPPFCIDTTGKKLFTLGQYMFMGPYSEGLAKAFVNYNYNTPDYRLGYVDKQGNMQVSTNYVDGGDFKNGYAIVLDVLDNDSAYTLIDTTGKAFLADFYPSISTMSADGLAAIKNVDGYWGYTNASGEMVIPFQYIDASDFVDGMALVNLNGKVGGIDVKGKKILDYDYELGQVLNKTNYLVLKKGGKWGVLDKKGKPIISFKYDNMANFSDGVAWAFSNEVWGILDTKGNWKSTPDVAAARGFENGVATFVDDSGKWGVINKKGEILLAPRFDDISDLYQGKFVVTQNKGYERTMLK